MKGLDLKISRKMSGKKWAELAEKLPISRSEQDERRLDQIFSEMDVNGNGYLSLAEVDKGLKDVLKSD